MPRRHLKTLSRHRGALSDRSFRERVIRYWNETHQSYLQHVGTTLQAGWVSEESAPTNSASVSNLSLARRAEIRPGQRILDAGCGVCGPSIDIAHGVGNVQIDAVTICKAQAETAVALIRDAGLSGKINVRVCDFHQLPFQSHSFDVVFFFESFGYSYDIRKILAESFRVTRPGGTLYIKEVFRRGHALTVQERQELAEFNRIFAFRAPALNETAAAAQAAGYENIHQGELTPWVSTTHNLDAMFEVVDGRPQPTAFGKRHFRAYECLPVFFGEVKATRPK